MARRLILVALVLVGLAVPATSALAGSVGAGSLRYAKCSQLRADFPTGIARSASAASAVVTDGARRPRVSSTAYSVNRHLDKDHDGVACEVSSTAVTAPPQAGTIDESELAITGEEAFVYDLVNAFIDTWPSRSEQALFCRDLADEAFADQADGFYADLAAEAQTYYDIDPADSRPLVESTMQWLCAQFGGVDIGAR